MKDRQPTYPGRVKLSPVDGQANTYDLEMADVPLESGTPLNKSTLLADSTAALMSLGNDATPDDMFKQIAANVIQNTNNIGSIITYGTDDMVSGTTPLETGKVYFYYE